MAKTKKAAPKKAQNAKMPKAKTMKAAAKKSAAQPKAKAKSKTIAKKAAPKAAASKARATKTPATKSNKASAKAPALAKKTVKKAVQAKTPSTTTAKVSRRPGDFLKFFSPLDNRVVVEKTALATRTPGGLYIPDSAEDASRSHEGEVVAVGSGHRTKKGKVRQLDVKVGDRVLFNLFSGSELSLDGQDYLILREDEIIAVVNPS